MNDSYNEKEALDIASSSERPVEEEICDSILLIEVVLFQERKIPTL